jgi:hypothetical protein
MIEKKVRWKIAAVVVLGTLLLPASLSMGKDATNLSQTKMDRRITLVCTWSSPHGTREFSIEIPNEYYQSMLVQLQDLTMTSSTVHERENAVKTINDLASIGLITSQSDVRLLTHLVERPIKRLQTSGLSSTPKDNYLCLVLGIGKNTKSAGPYSLILADYLYTLYYNFNWKICLPLANLIMTVKPFILSGHWYANSGGIIITLGLSGLQHWSYPSGEITGVGLLGFIGLAVTPQQANSTGFIIGFSLVGSPRIPQAK